MDDEQIDMNDPQAAFDYTGRILKAVFPDIVLTDTLLGRLTQIDNAMTAIPQIVRDEHSRDVKEFAALCEKLDQLPRVEPSPAAKRAIAVMKQAKPV